MLVRVQWWLLQVYHSGAEVKEMLKDSLRISDMSGMVDIDTYCDEESQKPYTSSTVHSFSRLPSSTGTIPMHRASFSPRCWAALLIVKHSDTDLELPWRMYVTLAARVASALPFAFGTIKPGTK